jgi:hypothetical protein
LNVCSPLPSSTLEDEEEWEETMSTTNRKSSTELNGHGSFLSALSPSLSSLGMASDLRKGGRQQQKAPHKRSKEREFEREKERNKNIWCTFMKREAPRAARQYNMNRTSTLGNAKRCAQMCQKEFKKKALKNAKVNKEAALRAKKLARDTQNYWRRFEKEEREAKRRAEKEQAEKRKQEEELREAKRQQKKLNFLITQTELYSHFIGKKIATSTSSSSTITSSDLEEETSPGETDSMDLEGELDVEEEGEKDKEADTEEDEMLAKLARKNAQQALEQQLAKTKKFDDVTRADKDISAKALDEQMKEQAIPMSLGSGILSFPFFFLFFFLFLLNFIIRPLIYTSLSHNSYISYTSSLSLSLSSPSLSIYTYLSPLSPLIL